MKLIAIGLILSAVGFLFLTGADAPPALHFPLHRFSIAPLEASTAGANSMLISMSLPPTDGFAPNVNVIAQNYPGSLDDYIRLSKQQTANAGWNWIKADKADDSTAIIEFASKTPKISLHYYAKVSRKGPEIILITATATEKQWAADSTQLKACVDSFQRDAGQ